MWSPAPPSAVVLSLGRSESTVSDDLPSVFLSPSPEDEDALDFDLDALETPSDNESLAFPMYDLDVEGERSEVKESKACDHLFIFLSDCFSDDLRRLGVASSHHRGQCSSSRPRSDSKDGSLLETDQSGLGFLEREDVVDSHGIKWRCFATGDPPQESRVNVSVLEPFLRVLSHGGTASYLWAINVSKPLSLLTSALSIQVTMETVWMTSLCFPRVTCQKTVWKITSMWWTICSGNKHKCWIFVTGSKTDLGAHTGVVKREISNATSQFAKLQNCCGQNSCRHSGAPCGFVGTYKSEDQTQSPCKEEKIATKLISS